MMSNKPDWDEPIMEASCLYNMKDRNETIIIKRVDDGAGDFFFIETEGCAFNNINELVELMKDAAKRMGMEE